MNRWRAAAVLLAGILVAGCGSGGGDEASSPSSKVTSTSRAKTTTTTVAEPELLRIEPEDPVVVDCTDHDRVTISIARPADTETLVEVYDADIPTLLEPLGLSGGQVSACNSRNVYSGDFSKVVLTASTGSENHAVVIDLATNRAIDLTAPREGQGFSSGAPLNESGDGFYSARGALRLTDTVVVSRDGVSELVDLADPTKTRPVSDDLRWLSDISGIDYQPMHSRSIVSPDGRFLLHQGAATSSSIAAVDGFGAEPSTRRDIGFACSGIPEGWRDSRTAVVGSRNGENQIYLVPVDDAGVPGGCIPLLPTEDRVIKSSRLRLDAKVLLITVEGTRGDEHYEVDLANPGSEPASSGPPLALHPDSRVFFPRNS